MKRLLVVVAVATLTAFPVLIQAAGGSHPMGGCGLGYIWYGKNATSVSGQSCAHTTNNTVASNLFGITSGTSGCTPDGLVSISKKTERYVEVNYDSLRADIAKGQGEYIEGLVNLLGVKDVKKSTVVLMLKKDFATLFPNQETTFDGFLRNLQKILTANLELLA
ncbi:hypothetical protein BVX98_07030 [bacterium F11]|nr:hypothetical protein BVX98_07030 [bacterium F11]